MVCLCTCLRVGSLTFSNFHFLIYQGKHNRSRRWESETKLLVGVLLHDLEHFSKCKDKMKYIADINHRLFGCKFKFATPDEEWFTFDRTDNEAYQKMKNLMKTLVRSACICQCNNVLAILGLKSMCTRKENLIDRDSRVTCLILLLCHVYFLCEHFKNDYMSVLHISM